MIKRLIKKLLPPTDLDVIIQDVEVMMTRYNPTDEEYQSLLKTYERLMELRNSNKRKPIDMNVVLTVLANLAGVLLVINAERLQGLNSKVWGLLLRPRS
jgi:hypothetical protein